MEEPVWLCPGRRWAGVQSPERLALPTRAGVGDRDLMRVSVFIGPITYFYELILCLQLCALGVQIPILQVRKLSLRVVSGLAHCTCALSEQHQNSDLSPVDSKNYACFTPSRLELMYSNLELIHFFFICSARSFCWRSIKADRCPVFAALPVDPGGTRGHKTQAPKAPLGCPGMATSARRLARSVKRLALQIWAPDTTAGTPAVWEGLGSPELSRSGAFMATALLWAWTPNEREVPASTVPLVNFPHRTTETKYKSPRGPPVSRYHSESQPLPPLGSGWTVSPGAVGAARIRIPHPCLGTGPTARSGAFQHAGSRGQVQSHG